jgi:hypothetical protein
MNALNPHRRTQTSEFTQNPMKASVMNRDAFLLYSVLINSKLKILMPQGYPCDKILMAKKIISSPRLPPTSNVKEFAQENFH